MHIWWKNDKGLLDDYFDYFNDIYNLAMLYHLFGINWSPILILVKIKVNVKIEKKNQNSSMKIFAKEAHVI